MRAINHLLLMGIAIIWCLAGTDARAQTSQSSGGQPQGGGRQRGNFDPAQFRQRMMDRYRERLEITDDAEWKAVQPLIQNVMDARSAASTGMRGGPGRGGRRGGGDANQTSTPPVRENPNPAAEELQKAVDSKLPAPEMKSALAKYIEYRKAKQAELEKARDALRAVLTSRQEAIATLSGLL